jgi:pimeloyl-ACP methyl ester carboxylesterase
MKVLLIVLGWLFSVLFGLLALSMILTKNYPHALLLILAVLLVLPPVTALARDSAGLTIPWWARGIAIVALLGGFVYLLTSNPAGSVYLTPEAEARHMAIYDEKVAQWPTPYEDIYVDTTYGRVHVIASGPEDGPPVLLLNAAAMSGWSWLPNVGALNARYRTYAVDTLGEAGKSRLTDVSVYPPDGKAYADLHVEITDALGIERAYVVGASFGGYMATSYALHYPERVERLALLGPMGMTPQTGGTVARITLASLFPAKPVRRATVRWALGDAPQVLDESEEWFEIVLTGTKPAESQPVAFTPEQLAGLEVPVLLVLGERDALTGDPEAVKALANHVPDIQIVVLDSGHLIGMEHPDRVNELIMTFFGES